MLTQQEICLIIAALQFWAEEMDLGDTQLLKLYAGDPSADQAWQPDEIQRLRSQLNSARLKYAVCDHKETELRTTELFPTREAARQAQKRPEDQIGVLLLPDPTPEV